MVINNISKSMSFGILQGRLSHSSDGRFQFSPLDWKLEFQRAAELGFSTIEWLFDWPDWKENPILSAQSEKEIFGVVESSGIPINSICADYFMKYRLAGPEGYESALMAAQLVQVVAKFTIQKVLLIPFLEQNAYPTEGERAEVIANLTPVLKQAERFGVRIGLETEMSVAELVPFLDRVKSHSIGVYYDIGNCTSYGFDCPSDLRILGKRVFGVHVKDRKVGSPQSLVLGNGDAHLFGCLNTLKDVGFEGTPIMQAWRGENYLYDAKSQLEFLQSRGVL